MTTSPPDISSLTLSPQRLQRQEASFDPQQQQQRFHDQPYHYETSPAGIPGYQPTKRAGLPSQWMGNTSTGTPPQGQLSDSRSLSPLHASDISSSGGSPPIPHPLQASQAPPIANAISPDDEIIPTAIVIKNIPFNVKRETLLDIIASLNIPTPYAFNYHLDQAGSFRGLAFANFRQASDADAVVAALNGFDVQGRKLRVEYKKVLQAGEKERIEREKALRRMRSMQLEKENLQQQTGVYDDFGVNQSPQGQIMPSSRSYSGVPTQPMLHSQPVPQPYIPNQQQQQSQLYSQPPPQPPVPTTPAATSTKSTTELDLNDPSTLEIYSRILLFKDDPMRDELAFSRTLTPKQRRVVHLVAQKLGVYHYSVGEGDERYAVVTRSPPGSGANDQPPPPAPPTLRPTRHLSQQQLSRSYLSPSSSGNPFSVQSTLGQEGGSYAAAAGTGSSAALRAKKSMPDMKSLHQAPRLTTRSSNGNIREGYATISSPMRRSPGFNIFNQNGTDSSGSAIPPVPMLSIPGVPVEGPPSAGGGAGSGVVRQPRGPGTGGFGNRNRSNVSPSDSRSPGGLDTRSHEPLEI